VAVPVTVLLVTLVTKNSSEPALMMAFWFCNVETADWRVRVFAPGAQQLDERVESVKSAASVKAPPRVFCTKPVRGFPGATVTGFPAGVSRLPSKPAAGAA